MTDWEAFRQALPKAAPEELIDWAARTQKDELGGELCLFSRESVSWLEEEPQEIMTPEDIEQREKSRRRTWGARCSCTACGEDFAAGWLRGLKLPGNREIRGIALLQGDDGLLYEGIPDMEAACWRMSAAEIAETDHFDCPLCGADVQLVRRKDLRSGRTHQVQVVTAEVIHGVTVLLYWMVRREFNEYGGSGAAAWPREAIALTEKGGLKRFTRAKCNQFGTEWDTGEWRAVRQMRDPETVKYYSWEANSHKKIGAAARPEVPDLTGSTGEKTGLEDYIRAGGQWPVQYLKLWKQHRNVENLARAGWGRTLGGAIEEMAWNQVMAPYAVHEIELRWIDWNEVKPGRMLGMSKAEVKALAGRWDWQTADAWAVYRCWQGGCTAEEFDRCRAELGPEGLQVLVSMIEDGHEVPLLKAARYIKKQEERRGGDLARTFFDYREMLDADAPEEELWPKDLVAAHDRLAQIHGDRDARQYTEAMRQLAQELAALAWSDGEICIRAAATPGELKEEGRVLKHCVGDYCKKHAARTDVIFFVRHARRPERSWYTLDINMTGRIPKEVQLHGYRNEWYGKAGHGKIPQKVRDFCDRWEREVLAPWYAQRQETARKNKQKRRKTSA